MSSCFLPVYMILNQMSSYPLSTKSILSFCAVVVWAGGDVDWEILDMEVLCGYFVHQNGSPHHTLLNSHSFSVPLIIFQWMLL